MSSSIKNKCFHLQFKIFQDVRKLSTHSIQCNFEFYTFASFLCQRILCNKLWRDCKWFVTRYHSSVCHKQPRILHLQTNTGGSLFCRRPNCLYHTSGSRYFLSSMGVSGNEESQRNYRYPRNQEIRTCRQLVRKDFYLFFWNYTGFTVQRVQLRLWRHFKRILTIPTCFQAEIHFHNPFPFKY